MKALANLLKLTLEKEISKIQILGDSKLVMDRINRSTGIPNLVLRPLFKQVKLIEHAINND